MLVYDVEVVYIILNVISCNIFMGKILNTLFKKEQEIIRMVYVINIMQIQVKCFIFLMMVSEIKRRIVSVEQVIVKYSLGMI